MDYAKKKTKKLHLEEKQEKLLGTIKENSRGDEMEIMRISP